MYPSKLLAKPLSKQDQIELIDRFKTALLASPGIKSLYLIGSASRYEMTDASDLDFIAVFANEDDLKRAQQNFYGKPRPADWPCDVLWYVTADFECRSKSGGICFVAAEDGVKLL